jgi:thiol-disulfide isomerase/thioredoxin
MQNKVKILSVLVITLIGLGVILYFSLNPKIHSDLAVDEKEYVIYFHQIYCEYCQEIASNVEVFIEETSLPVYKKNTAYLTQEQADDYGISGTPTMYYVKRGRIMNKAVGPDAVLKLMDKLANK